jgi:prepilin-type N-terminal cleavage/methylation domain-containing protein
VRRAFSLIELLVSIAVIATLMGVLLPGLAQARLTAKSLACLSRLKQIGVGLTLYFNDFHETLPQARGPLPSGGTAVIGALFAGTRGTLPFYGVNTTGADKRPLNRYVVSIDIPAQSPADPAFNLDAFRSPCDRGARNTGIPIPPFDAADSYYTLVGSSYTINDHALEGNGVSTLVPQTAAGDGGPMPPVRNTARTWMVGTQPIYNYESGADRGSIWYQPSRIEANLLFVDMHAKMRVRVPPGIADSTDQYTFLP